MVKGKKCSVYGLKKMGGFITHPYSKFSEQPGSAPEPNLRKRFLHLRDHDKDKRAALGFFVQIRCDQSLDFLLHVFGR